LLLALAVPPAATAQTAPAPSVSATKAPTSAEAADAVKLDQFVVTGVFNATEARKATTAITVSTSRSVNAGEWRCGRAGGMGKGRGRE
jgi:hypothetical protein